MCMRTSSRTSRKTQQCHKVTKMKKQERAKCTVIIFLRFLHPKRLKLRKQPNTAGACDWHTHIQTPAVKSQLTPRQPAFPKLVKVQSFQCMKLPFFYTFLSKYSFTIYCIYDINGNYRDRYSQQVGEIMQYMPNWIAKRIHQENTTRLNHY